MKRIIYILSVIIVVVGLYACGTDRLDVDVSNIEVNIEIKRLDVKLFEIPADRLEDHLPELRSQFGEFFECYNLNILAIGESTSTEYAHMLYNFLTHADVIELQKNCLTSYPDFTDIEPEFEQAFKHYKYHFPDAYIPEIYSCVSGFNMGVFTCTDSILGIGLDMFLGAESQYYDRLQGFHNYMKYKVYRRQIVPSAMQVVASGRFQFNDSIDNLLSSMIHEGKIKYFVEAMMPEAPDSIVIGYSSDQTEWCKQNESAMWKTLINENTLFSTDRFEIKKFVGEAAFTQRFAQKSPPRTGVWLGWQIVRSYMNNHPEIGLRELMENTDYQGILNEAKYKP